MPRSDLDVVRHEVNRWNLRHSRNYSTTFIVADWYGAVAPDYGRSPQETIDEQIADECDCCLAIFANRLGTPTGLYSSGTVHEINRFRSRDKYVGILHCRRDIDPDEIDHMQAANLRSYLTSITDECLVRTYKDDAELIHLIDLVLTSVMTKENAKIHQQLGHADIATAEAAEVHVRVESSERFRTFASHRSFSSRDWYLVLQNTGKAPAEQVRIELESVSRGEKPWRILGANHDECAAEKIDSGDEIRFHIVATDDSSRRVRCVISWIDRQGTQQIEEQLHLV
ncbi:hypothetical protein [Cryptosporangium phraense]|uniref:DUF4062 domain-containing protein n=1 Tax=Cryptosporangium phraense TaxID=2593070 RepID=A0A545AZF9_9ACTN|nr:hypothetical protein [Cryptosporangium phraense]TQS46711.1 hypothetical protein FL583_00050 [Cryptosporangium phraense]